MSTELPETGSLSQWQLTLLRFRRHRLAVASFYVLVFLYLLALGADSFAPYAPQARHLDHPYAPPQSLHLDVTEGLYTSALERQVDPVTLRKTYVEHPDQRVYLRFAYLGDAYRWLDLVPLSFHWVGVDERRFFVAHGSRDDGIKLKPTFFFLGSDRYGRDIFSRTLHGAKISLSVGLIGVLLTLILGVSIGGISGYFGGWVDTLLQRFIEVVQSFPQLPLWIAFAAVLPGDWSSLKIYFAITLLLSLLNWTSLARVVRGKILALREEDYAVAARLMGASHWRILFRHLLPGFTSHIVVALTLSVPGMILGETALSFLGLGLRPPIVSWGVMLQDCMDVKAVSFYPWLLSPVVFIVTMVLSFNFFGDGVRDAADPYG